MLKRIYWFCCVLMVFLAANVVALHVARGDEPCSRSATDAAELVLSPGPTSAPSVLTVAESFLLALNAERQKHGLQPVIHSDKMAATAAANNQCQASRGIGHHVLGGFGQCAAGPFNSMREALTAWLNSPAHRALILAPDLTMVGYSQLGPWHSVSTWQGGVQDLQASTPPPSVDVPMGCTGGAPTVRRGLFRRARVQISFGAQVSF